MPFCFRLSVKTDQFVDSMCHFDSFVGKDLQKGVQTDRSGLPALTNNKHPKTQENVEYPYFCSLSCVGSYQGVLLTRRFPNLTSLLTLWADSSSGLVLFMLYVSFLDDETKKKHTLSPQLLTAFGPLR